MATKEYRRHSDNGYKSSEFVNESAVRTLIKTDTRSNRDLISYENGRYIDMVKPVKSRSEGSVTSDRSGSDHSPKNSKPSHRPKSARPESRWQRRTQEEDDLDLPTFDSDSDSEVSHTTEERPMSARPDSRVARNLAANQILSQQHVERPSRPKTSHGRKTPENLECRDNVAKQQMKSRNGNKEIWQLENSEKWQRHVEPKTSNKREKKDSFSESNKLHYDQDPGLQSNGRAAAKTQTIVDKHLTYEAIDNVLFGTTNISDLDVDPVEFFNTPEPVSKPSLSNDVITLITNGPSRDNRKYRGNHSNNQNKQTFSSELSDHYHGNGVFSQTSRMGKKGMISTSQTRRAPDSISERSNYVRDGGSFKRKVPINQEPRVVSLGTGERVHMQIPFRNGQKKKDTQITAMSRQPRKLKPLHSVQSRIE